MSVRSIPFYPENLAISEESLFFWCPKCPFWTPAAPKRDIKVIWNFTPIFISSTLRIFYVKMATSDGGMGVSTLHILSWETTPEFLTFLLEKICFLLTSNLQALIDIYSDRFWCDHSYAIIVIYKITTLWKYFDKKTDFYRWKNYYLVWNKTYSDIFELDLSDEIIWI